MVFERGALLRSSFVQLVSSMRLLLPFMTSISIFTISVHAYHLLPDAENRSADMMCELLHEINAWNYDNNCCDLMAINGIKMLTELNSSHPIKEGIALIHFIRKSNRVRWIYHCCIGFVDLYLEKDWFIDPLYHLMVDHVHPRLGRMIEKEQYLKNIPNTVEIFIIPFTNMECFIDQCRHNLSVFSKRDKSSSLFWFFDASPN